MLKREKEVFGFLLDTEEAVMKELEEQYRKALEDINTCIMVMQADELTQSKVYRIEYQKTLKKQVEAILEKLHSDEFTTMQQYLSGAYTDAYVGTVYALHGQGVPVLMPIDQTAAVKAVLTDSKINTDLYTHLGVDITKLKKAIRNEITRGIASGMLYQDIARNVSFTTGTPLNRAKNIVQTEGHRIQQASAHDARHHAISRGADLVKQWDATLDGATRDTHRKLDGQIREVDDPFEMDGKEAQYPGDFNDPAEDCRCRCVALSRARSALDEAELETMKERAEFFKLDKTKDFEDFKKKYLKAAEEEAKAKPAAPKFVPAQTIEEAEEYARSHFVVAKDWSGNGNVSYKGISLESANELNMTLAELFEGTETPRFYNILPMNFRQNMWKSSENAPMAYRNLHSGELYFNPRIMKTRKTIAAYQARGREAWDKVTSNPDFFKGYQREMVDKYIAAGRQLVSDDAPSTLAGWVQHEFGHHIHHRAVDSDMSKVVKAGFEQYAVRISGYATSSYGEYVAESFAAYKNGEGSRIDPELLSFFEGAGW